MAFQSNTRLLYCVPMGLLQNYAPEMGKNSHSTLLDAVDAVATSPSSPHDSAAMQLAKYLFDISILISRFNFQLNATTLTFAAAFLFIWFSKQLPQIKKCQRMLKMLAQKQRKAFYKKSVLKQLKNTHTNTPTWWLRLTTAVILSLSSSLLFVVSHCAGMRLCVCAYTRLPAWLINRTNTCPIVRL